MDISLISIFFLLHIVFWCPASFLCLCGLVQAYVHARLLGAGVRICAVSPALGRAGAALRTVVP